MTDDAKKVIDEAQKLVDEIVRDNSSPFIHYLRAHELKMLDDKFRYLDNLLDAGVIKGKEVA